MFKGIKLRNRLVFVTLSVDNSLNITFEVPGMKAVISNSVANNIKLMDETFYKRTNHEKIL